MESSLSLAVFAVLIFITTVFYPISGFFEVKKLREKISEEGSRIKVKFFHQTIWSSWGSIIPIIVLLMASEISFANLGFRKVNLDHPSVSSWMIYTGLSLYCIHLLYFIYTMAVFRLKPESRSKVAQGISDSNKIFLPVTKEEKERWVFLSFSAGITEEILYRGYFFFAFSVVFPDMSIYSILIIATAIFGLGHIYLGKDAINSTISGLLFGIYYIVFQSILPVILIHTIQDLLVKDILSDEMLKSKR